MASADPFFAVRADVTDQYNALNQKLSQFHGLQVSNPQRKQLASKMESDSEFIKSQVWQGPSSRQPVEQSCCEITCSCDTSHTTQQ